VRRFPRGVKHTPGWAAKKETSYRVALAAGRPLLDTIAPVDPGFPPYRNIDMNLDFRWLPRHAPRSS
jgi:hypothetical protein